MGNDISVGSVTNINVTDISPHLTALVDASSMSRAHGRIFTNLRCRYNKQLTPAQQQQTEKLAPDGNGIGYLEQIGVSDPEIRWEDGIALSVKVFLKSYDDAQEKLQIKKALERAIAVDKIIRAKLVNSTSQNPMTNCLRPISILHQDVFRVTERAIWVARPWIQHSLMQRVQMRPYCSMLRRLFFAYQLLRGLQQLHEEIGIAHGDLKPENVLVDSHGWLYLVDISSFYKPTFLPSYNPEVFEKTFNTGVRSACCIAPERFLDNTPESGPRLSNPFSEAPSKSCDLFSAASVMVSLLNDVPCFLSLSDVLELRRLIVAGSKKKAEHFFRDKITKAAVGNISAAVDSDICDMLVEMALGIPRKENNSNNSTTKKNNNNNNNNNTARQQQANTTSTSSSSASAGGFTASDLQDQTSPSSSVSQQGDEEEEEEEEDEDELEGEKEDCKISLENNMSRSNISQITQRYTGLVFPPSFQLLYEDIFPGLMALSPDLRTSLLFKNLQAIVDQIIELDYNHSGSRRNDDENDDDNSSESGSSSGGDDHESDEEGEEEGESERNNNKNENEKKQDNEEKKKKRKNKKNEKWIDTSFFSTQQEMSVTLERVAQVKSLSKQIRKYVPTLTAAFECLSSIFVQCVRRCLLEQNLLMALSLIARAAPLFPDSTLRDPLLPLIVSILQSSVDTTDMVRVFALDALVYVCAALGTQLTPSNAFTFEDYVLPALCEYGTSNSRSPACMVTLARALPITFLLSNEVAERREAMGPGFQSGYGYFALKSITTEKVWETMKRLLTNSNTSVVVTAVRSLPPLLPHLSSDTVVVHLLPLLSTCLGSSYVELRREMYSTIFEVVGHCLPEHQLFATICLDQAISKEDDVLCMAAALEGLRKSLMRGTFARATALDYVKKTAFLITHTSREVARAAALVIEAAVATLDPVELAVFVFAPIAAFLRSPLPLEELVARNYDAIKPPCRVPDPTSVIVVEGSEYTAWCRDIRYLDVGTKEATLRPADSHLVISVTEVERAVQTMKDSGIDLDPFFNLRAPPPQEKGKKGGEEGGEGTTTEKQNEKGAEKKSHHHHQHHQHSIMYNEKRGKLFPKLQIRQQERLKEIALADSIRGEESSPWWSSSNQYQQGGGGGDQQSVGAFAGNQSFGSSPAEQQVSNKHGRGNTVIHHHHAGVSNTTTGNPNNTNSSSSSTTTTNNNNNKRAPRPTGVSVASHSEAHRGGVRCMTTQMHFLATGGNDGSVRVWDTQDAMSGAGYLDGRVHRDVFAAIDPSVLQVTSATNSPSSFQQQSRAGEGEGDSSSLVAAESVSNYIGSPSVTTTTTAVSRNNNNNNNNNNRNSASITALHFLGSHAGHSLVVGNEEGNACVYNVVGEASEPIPWATRRLQSDSREDIGAVCSLSTPGSSESVLFLGMAGGVVGAIDLRSPSSNSVWTAKTPCSAGPLVDFLFPGRDKFWACVSVNRNGLVALWDLRMRAIVGSTDVIDTAAASSSSSSKTKKSSGGGGAGGEENEKKPIHLTCACVCESSFGSSSSTSLIGVPSIAVATDTAGIHQIELRTLSETLCMKPTTVGSVRTLASLGNTLYSAGSDCLMRTWDLSRPDKSFTVSRGLEPSPPYSMTSSRVVAEALPAAVDMLTMGGWIDIAESGTSMTDEPNGTPLHSDAISCMSIVRVSPHSRFDQQNPMLAGNKSFGSKSAAATAAASGGVGGAGAGQFDSEQIHVCTGSRDGSVALWRNAEN